jgi:hypothetical protein
MIDDELTLNVYSVSEGFRTRIADLQPLSDSTSDSFPSPGIPSLVKDTPSIVLG